MAKRQEILHCPPYEGIGREKAADVRKHGFIRRASGPCVLTYKRADVARPPAVKRCCDSTASTPLFFFFVKRGKRKRPRLIHTSTITRQCKNRLHRSSRASILGPFSMLRGWNRLVRTKGMLAS